MRKNLFDKTTAEDIIARTRLLQADSKGNWGTMNATEMLLHCNKANQQIFDDTEMDYKKSTLKQQVLKFLSLYIVPQFPKNIKGAAKNDTRGKINPEAFEEQKRKFIETIQKFPDRKGPIKLMHPAFGRLSTKQWGIAAWKHMDHHLRQFGV